MRISCLATLALAISALTGCGADNPDDAQPKPKQAPFEIDGNWTYLGPSDVPHILTVDDASMKYTAVAGDWSSTWTIKSYDNEANHFRVAFASGSGMYLPMGTALSGTYDLNGTVLTVQSAQGETGYPPLVGAGSCTSPTDGMPVPDCRLYIKAN